MALSTNLARIVQIILGPCTGVLQDILRKEIVPSALSHNVKTFLANQPQNKKPPINKTQKQLVYGEDYSKFDITLLYFLLRNMCSIPPHTNQWGNDPSPGDRSVSANIERVRFIRNEYYGHVMHFSLSDAEFEQKWNIIFQVVKELESYLGTNINYQDDLTRLKTCPMDPVTEANYKEKLSVLERNLCLDVSNLKEIVEEIKKSIDPVVIKESQLDKDIFEQWEEDNKLFISTKACREVERLTRNQNLVIVAGNSGSGKSAIIQHIALKYRSQGWVVKLVNEAKEIQSLFSSVLQNKTIFVLNDPIGKKCLDEIAYNSWKIHEEKLNVCLKKTKLLMSCRKYILGDDRIKGLLKDKSNILDINNERLKLNDDEKIKILKIHAYACDNKLSEEGIDDIKKIEEYFPLLCKLYFSKNRKQHDELFTFFKEPTAVVVDEIRSFRIASKEKYCALVLLALLNTVPSVNDLRKNDNSRKMFKIALELSGMQENTPPHIIGDALTTLNGYFVKKIGDAFSFYHDFVMEVTAFVFGTDYPTDAIKYADVSFLRKRVRIKSNDVENDRFTVYVGDEHIADLGKRLFAELFGKRFLHVVLNPCLKHEKLVNIFIKNFKDRPEKLKRLLKNKELSSEHRELDQRNEFYFTKLSFLKMKNEMSPLFALVAYCHPQLSFYCLESLSLMQTEINDMFLFSAVCCNGSLDVFHLFTKDQKKKSLTENWGFFYPIHIVSMFHNFEILHELIQFGINVNLSADNVGWTALTLAALNDTQIYNDNSSQTNQYKTLQLLLCNGAIINACVKPGVSPLYIACQSGHINTLNLLLSYGADINLCLENGASPFHVACENGHDQAVKLLLCKGANVNLFDNDRITPLLRACKSGHETTVQLLIGNGADINLCAEYGLSPIYIACQNGYERIVNILLRKGANINLCLKTGHSPLHIACDKGHESVINLLLCEGADVNLCNNDGISAFHRACHTGHDSTINLLLSKGANINLCAKNGASPLAIACQNGHESVVNILIRNEANVNLCVKNGATPLIISCENGHESTIQLLLRNCVDVNKCDENGASPLYIACQKGHYSIVQLLLSYVVDVNSCEKTGKSPLFVASYEQHDNIVQCLLSYGADINLCSENSVSPLYVACQEGHTSTVQVLLSHGADINLCRENGISPLFAACENGHHNTVQFLLSQKADINLSMNSGASPLFIACQNGQISIVQDLLQNEADVNLCSKIGASPLYIACQNRHDIIATLLLTYGADINLCLEDRSSPLYVACQNGHESTVRLLLLNGAHINGAYINLGSNEGVTPLIIACCKGHMNIVQLLLSFGADINLCLEDGFSPLTIAYKNGHASIVQMLIAYAADID